MEFILSSIAAANEAWKKKEEFHYQRRSSLYVARAKEV